MTFTTRILVRLGLLFPYRGPFLASLSVLFVNRVGVRTAGGDRVQKGFHVSLHKRDASRGT